MSTASGRSPRDEAWDCLTEFFGDPRTKTERTMFGKVVAELLEAGASEDEVRRACEYVLARFDSPSVFAVTKWLTTAQRQQARPQGADAIAERLRRQDG